MTKKQKILNKTWIFKSKKIKNLPFKSMIKKNLYKNQIYKIYYKTSLN